MGLIVTKFQRHGKQPSPCESQLLLGLCACRRTDDRRRHYTSWLGCQILPHTNHFHPFNCQLSSEFYTPIYRSCIRVNQAPSMHRITGTQTLLAHNLSTRKTTSPHDTFSLRRRAHQSSLQPIFLRSLSHMWMDGNWRRVPTSGRSLLPPLEHRTTAIEDPTTP